MTRGWFLLVWVNRPPIFKGMLGLTLFNPLPIVFVTSLLNQGQGFPLPPNKLLTRLPYLLTKTSFQRECLPLTSNKPVADPGP